MNKENHTKDKNGFFNSLNWVLQIRNKKSEHNDKKDTMTKIISKNKSVEILDYFLNFPFAKVLSNETKKTLVVHAGILPAWSIEDVKAANEELTSSL